MKKLQNKLISIIIPAFNEADNINKLAKQIFNSTEKLRYDFELLFIDDGSTDNTAEIVKSLAKRDPQIKLLRLSRNFGKELAMTAGIQNCKGDACIIIDADIQHPPKHIPEFIQKWEQGSQVVIGIRESNRGEGLVKKYGSKLFYFFINKVSNTKMLPGSTDFRLLDREVIDEVSKITEHNRMTRGLIDWLGFDRNFVYFKADERNSGKAGYSLLKLIRLAFNSIVSLSLFPLKLAGYLGIMITVSSGILGVAVITGKYILRNNWGLSITGTASLALMLLFLIGIVLTCLGLIALYIASIHQEVIGRPLYIIRREK